MAEGVQYYFKVSSWLLRTFKMIYFLLRWSMQLDIFSKRVLICVLHIEKLKLVQETFLSRFCKIYCTEDKDRLGMEFSC